MMPADELSNHFRHVRNLGRIETPQAWAFDNADLLAQGVPVLLKIIETYEKTLRRIVAIDNDPEWMKEIAVNVLDDKEAGLFFTQLKAKI
jgi:hypothetical protein